MKRSYRFISSVLSAVIAVNTAAVLNTEVSAKETEDWQEIYASFLTGHLDDEEASESYIDAFSVYDIDRDGTPELICSNGDYHGAYGNIYTVYDGKLKELGGVGSNGICTARPDKKYVAGFYMGMGCTNTDYYSIENGELKRVISFEDDSGNHEDDKDITWIVNDKKVTAEEYEKKLDEVRTGTAISLGRTFPLDKNSIEYAVTGVKDHKTAYITLLSDAYLSSYFLQDSDSFALIDIMGDKTPELIVSQMGQTDVFTFTDGRVQLAATEYPARINADDAVMKIGRSRDKRLLFMNMTSAKDKAYSYSVYSITKTGLTALADIRCEKIGGKYWYYLNDRPSTASGCRKILQKYKGIKVQYTKKVFGINKEDIKRALR